MVERLTRTTSLATSIALLFSLSVTCTGALIAQEPTPSFPAVSECVVDLANPGIMKDIISNALRRGLRLPEPKIAAFLDGAESDYATGELLLQAAARHFAIDATIVAEQVQKFAHCNCAHAQKRDTATAKFTDFAKDVTLHVVLHEMAHALVREFDLPILGNEETMADAFATHYLTTYLPDRAAAVLKARTTSWMMEAAEVPREEWTVRGEHNNDARRAFQVAALAVAAHPTDYHAVAKAAGMTERDITKARDYGNEIHRSWRRTLAPLWMPEGVLSNEARVVCDEKSPLFDQLRASGLIDELESAIRRFDWHSGVKIHFVEGDGGAGWSRSQRTITVHSAYLARFIAQGLRRVGD